MQLLLTTDVDVEKKRDDNMLDTNVQPANAAGNAAELALLTKTLEHLSEEAIKKEEKAQHSLRVRLVRDKLVACKRRIEVFLQRLNLSSKKKKPDATLLEKLEANEEEIERLEAALVTVQEEERRRHSNMIVEEKRRAMSGGVTMIGIAIPMIGTSGSFESTSGIESSSGIDSGGNDDSGGNNIYNKNGKESGRNRDIVVVENAGGGNDSMPGSTPNITTCMECNLIPTNHTSLKCKKVCVCSCCCDVNRGLHNITWCKTCFANESPAIQELIRNGDYNNYTD